MNEHPNELGAIAAYWFDVMRRCGDDVRELLHDGHPTACVADAAFAYVNAFKARVNVGFFRGAELADPNGQLEGTGKFMRHVKLRPQVKVDAPALLKLIDGARGWAVGDFSRTACRHNDLAIPQYLELSNLRDRATKWLEATARRIERPKVDACRIARIWAVPGSEDVSQTTQ